MKGYRIKDAGFAIYREKESGTLYMMKPTASLLAELPGSYSVVTSGKLGREWLSLPNHAHKARKFAGHNGKTYYVFSDYSAIEV